MDLIPGEPGSVQNPKLFHLPPTAEQLEIFWLLCLFVAGKNAKVQQDKLRAFLAALRRRYAGRHGGPLSVLASLDEPGRDAVIYLELRDCKAGQYTRLHGAIMASTKLAPFLTCSPQGMQPEFEIMRRDLIPQLVPGAGLKTASFFMLYGHGLECAVLDTHIIAYLKSKRELPQKFNLGPHNYRQAEIVFLELCAKMGRKPWDMDFEIWAERSKSSNIDFVP